MVNVANQQAKSDTAAKKNGGILRPCSSGPLNAVLIEYVRKLTRPVKIVKEKIADGRSQRYCQQNIQQTGLCHFIRLQHFFKIQGRKGPPGETDKDEMGYDGKQAFISNLGHHLKHLSEMPGGTGPPGRPCLFYHILYSKKFTILFQLEYSGEAIKFTFLCSPVPDVPLFRFTIFRRARSGKKGATCSFAAHATSWHRFPHSSSDSDQHGTLRNG